MWHTHIAGVELIRIALTEESKYLIIQVLFRNYRINIVLGEKFLAFNV